MKVQAAQLQRYHGCADYKVLRTWQEQAFYLRKNTEASLRVIAEHLGQPYSSVKRAIKALADGRRPGVAGRPTSLTAEEEEEVLCMREAAQLAGESTAPCDLIRML